MGDVLNRGSKDKPRWYCRYVDVDGKRKQKATHQPTRALALQYLAAIEGRVARGEVGIKEVTAEEKKRKTITIAELTEKFLADYSSPKIKSMKRYRRDARSRLKLIGSRIGNRPASSITLRDVEQLRDAAVEEKLAAETVVHTLRILSKPYNWARREGHIDCANPVSGVERPRLHHSLDYLSHAEVGQLLAEARRAAVEPATHNMRVRFAMIATAIYCGLRKGELFGLRRSDVALDAGRLDINRSYNDLPKGGKPRHVPMHPDLVPILGAFMTQRYAHLAPDFMANEVSRLCFSPPPAEYGGSHASARSSLASRGRCRYHQRQDGEAETPRDLRRFAAAP